MNDTTMQNTMQYQALLVDDHPVIIHALEIFLQRDNIQVVGKAGDGAEAVKLAKTLDPDLIILDIAIPVINGLEVVQRIRTMGLRAKVLVFTSQNADSFARRCRQAGASGFISKGGDFESLLVAIRAIRCGYTFFPAESAPLALPTQDGVYDEAARLASLSEREMMVLIYLAKGYSNMQIAEALTLSNKTISTYKTRLQLKLEASNVVDLIGLAQRNNLVD